jgi:hypothetical protein
LTGLIGLKLFHKISNSITKMFLKKEKKFDFNIKTKMKWKNLFEKKKERREKQLKDAYN